MKLFLIFILALLAACSQTPEEQLLHILETRYANLYINDTEHKLAVIKKLEAHLTKHRLNAENLPTVRSILHEMNDGHVQLRDTSDNRAQMQSGLVFASGSSRIESCANCHPSLPKGSYTVSKINQTLADDWLKDKQNQINASTPWGREYRTWRLLEFSPHPFPLELELRDSENRTFKTTVQWQPRESQVPCVKGQRLNETTYQITIKSLWCHSAAAEGRKDILNRFKTQWEEVIDPIQPQDKIILDLRENSGGGDEETLHVLATFLDSPIPVYHYKYLRTTAPGIMKYMVRATYKLWPLWQEEEKQSLDPRHEGKTLRDNPMEILIGPGCFSSCEVVADVLKFAKRGPLIGSVTHGGAGEPVDIPIEGTSYVLTLPACFVWKTDGRPYEGEGVTPN